MLTCLLIGIFAVLPFIPHMDMFNGAVSGKSLFLLLACGALLICGGIQFWRKGRSEMTGGYVYIAGAAAMITTLISSVFGSDFAHSFFGDALRSVGVLLLLVLGAATFLCTQIFREEDWRKFRYAVLASGVGVSALTILGTRGMGLETFVWFDLTKPGVTFANDTFAGLYLVLVLVVGFLQLVRETGRKSKFAVAAGIGLILCSPVLLGWSTSGAENFQLFGSARASSMAAICLLGTFLVFTLTTMLRSVWEKQIATALIFLVTAAVAWGSFLLISPGSDIREKLQDDTTSARFITWNLSIEAIKERPVIGWGIAEFDKAFEMHFDPALYTKAGLVEVWFDKAHNVTLDTLVSVGVLGAVAFGLLIAVYLGTLHSLHWRGKLESRVFLILGIFPSIHLIQLQTSFDIAPTYALWMFIGAYVMWLERELEPKFKVDFRIPIILMLVLGLIGVGFGISEFSRQQALVTGLSESRAGLRYEMVEHGLSRRSDFEGLHRSANLFIESVYNESSESGDIIFIQATPYLEQYLNAYSRYLFEEPSHYRARANYTYLLLVHEAWGGEGAAKAEAIIRDSYQYSPHNPLTYVLHTMALVMLNDLTAADEKLTEAEAMFGPGIKILEDTRSWLSRQKEGDAKHTLLRIGNI